MTLANGSLIGNGTDSLVSVETAELTGSAGPNALNASAFTLGSVTLTGGDGNDDLLGGSQGDTLTGGLGVDTFAAGGGDDVVQARDGNTETTLSCGAGAQDSAVVDPGDAADQCENVERDTTAPETTIASGPSASTTAREASFAFSANEAGSTFECALDGAAFSACSSPQSYSGLALGAHTFQVRATDAAGNTDATPAQASWTITEPVQPPPPPVVKCKVPKLKGKTLAQAKTRPEARELRPRQGDEGLLGQGEEGPRDEAVARRRPHARQGREGERHDQPRQATVGPTNE